MAISRKKQAVWNRAARVRGKSPAKYRRDPYGNEIYHRSYGKDSPKGWQIDHIRPKSRGGSNALRNLQALKSSVNRRLGASLFKRSRHSR